MRQVIPAILEQSMAGGKYSETNVPSFFSYWCDDKGENS